MKTKILLSFFTLSFMLFNGISCKRQSANFNDKEITGMLKDFYTSYIVERSKMPENFKKIDSTVKKYCTIDLQNQLKNEDIDYDLLLNGQFCEKEWLNTMSINKDSNDNSIYNVSFEFMADGKTKQKNIKLQIVKNNVEYKINKVIEFK
jgi:hypothetical protein